MFFTRNTLLLSFIEYISLWDLSFDFHLTFTWLLHLFYALWFPHFNDFIFSDIEGTFREVDEFEKFKMEILIQGIFLFFGIHSNEWENLIDWSSLQPISQANFVNYEFSVKFHLKNKFGKDSTTQLLKIQTVTSGFWPHHQRRRRRLLHAPLRIWLLSSNEPGE